MGSETTGRRTPRLAFLGGLAHDLRNPLGVLRGVVGCCAAKRARGADPDIGHALEIVDRQVVRMDRIAGDFLDAVRMEGGWGR